MEFLLSLFSLSFILLLLLLLLLLLDSIFCDVLLLVRSFFVLCSKEAGTIHRAGSCCFFVVVVVVAVNLRRYWNVVNVVVVVNASTIWTDGNTTLTPRRKPYRSSLLLFITLLRTVINFFLECIFGWIHQSLERRGRQIQSGIKYPVSLSVSKRIFAMVGLWSRCSSFVCSSRSSLVSFGRRCCFSPWMDFGSCDGWLACRGFAFVFRKFSIFHNQSPTRYSNVHHATCIKWGGACFTRNF